eukprot:4786266-Pyramimonas_sp.AAC.1
MCIRDSRPRRREANRAPHRAASAMHWRCGAFLRSYLHRVRLGGLEILTPCDTDLRRRDLFSAWTSKEVSTKIPQDGLLIP